MDKGFGFGGCPGAIVHHDTGAIEHREHIAARTVVATQTVSSGTGTRSVSYLHRDHLGSVDTVTDETAQVIARMSFDAFGKMRDPLTWSGDPSSTQVDDLTDVTRRGYTGHEELTKLGLTHMNGRVYDSQVGRMVSADPHVPRPLEGQSWNRFSYVTNRPLSSTDPSGYADVAGGRAYNVIQDGNHVFNPSQQGLQDRKDKAMLQTVIAASCAMDTFCPDGGIGAGSSWFENDIDWLFDDVYHQYAAKLRTGTTYSTVTQCTIYACYPVRVPLGFIVFSGLHQRAITPSTWLLANSGAGLMNGRWAMSGVTTYAESSYLQQVWQGTKLRGRFGVFGSVKTRFGPFQVSGQFDLFSFWFGGDSNPPITQGIGIEGKVSQYDLGFGFSRSSLDGGGTWSDWQWGLNAYNLGSSPSALDLSFGGGLFIGGEVTIPLLPSPDSDGGG